MSILIVLFGLLSDCLLSVLVGIIGRNPRHGSRGGVFGESWGLSSPC